MTETRAWCCKVGDKGYFLDTVRIRRKLSIKAYLQGTDEKQKPDEVKCVPVVIKEVADGDN